MSYEKVTHDLNLYSTHRFSSVEENQEVMKSLGIDQQVRQISPGAFKSNLFFRSANEVNLFADSFNTATSIILEAPTDTVGLLFIQTPCEQVFASGEEVANHKLLFIPPDGGADIISVDMVSSLSIAISEPRFIEISEAIFPAHISKYPNHMLAINGDPEKLYSLREKFHRVIFSSELEKNEKNLSDLIVELTYWIFNASNEIRPEGFSVRSSKQRIARRTREYLEENYKDTVKLENMCRELGVGLRTMQRCFSEYFQIPPYYYLKTIRLNNIRNILLKSNASDTTVAYIALQNGYTHAGNFSNDYKKMFGEPPSLTLNQER